MVSCQNSAKELLIYNLVTNAEKKFSTVAAYSFSGNGKVLLIKATDGPTTSLQYVNLAQRDPKIIWTTKEKTSIGSYNIDYEGRQVAFNIVDSDDADKTGIWYYKAGTDKAVLKLNNGMKDVPDGQTISDAVSFTDNSKYLQFSLQAKPAATGKSTEDMAGVEVWNYKDVYLQSLQSERLNKVARYNAIMNIESGKIVFGESGNKKLSLLKGDFAVVKTDYREVLGDRFWEKEVYKDSTWIMNLRNGSSYLLPAKAVYNIWFSPDNNWLVYFDADKGCHYFSYDLHTGVLKDIL